MSYYDEAVARWTNAAENVRRFDTELDAIVHNIDSKGSEATTLFKNVNAKGNKARTTLAGEAAEPAKWSCPDVLNCTGPQGSSGPDTRKYAFSSGAPSSTRGIGEIKNTTSDKSIKDAIGKAYGKVSKVNVNFDGTRQELQDIINNGPFSRNSIELNFVEFDGSSTVLAVVTTCKDGQSRFGIAPN
jgi:hypothetical protein